MQAFYPKTIVDYMSAHGIFLFYFLVYSVNFLERKKISFQSGNFIELLLGLKIKWIEKIHVWRKINDIWILDNNRIRANLNHKGNKNSLKTGNALQLFFSLSYSLAKQLKKRGICFDTQFQNLVHSSYPHWPWAHGEAKQ